MIASILDLPVALSAVVFIGTVMVTALASYAVARRVMGAAADLETPELAGSVLFRVAALHGLVVALVFAQELGSIRDVEVVSAREAAMLGDIYYDLRRYGSEAAEEVRDHLARYCLSVVEEEWDLLADSRSLSDTAWQEWELAYEGLLDLAPETPRQERLLNFLLDDVRALSELREARENAARQGSSSLFIIAALSGILLISAAYFTWPPTPLNLGLIAGFSAYTGLIVFFVVAYANPYHAPGSAEPTAFERFLSDEVRGRTE